jgi:hypothetical protein
MLWLYAFGYIMQDLSGNRLIFPIYIYGALAGAVFFIIALYSIPVLQPAKGLYYLAGSSTGSMAIAIAVTTMAPNYRIFRNIGTGIPVWVLTSIFLLINFISAFANKNPNSFGILGAAFAGFIFVFFLRRGKDGSTWMNNLYDWFINLFNPHKQKPGSSVKEKVFYNTGSRQPYTRSANVTQQRVDEILDKINQKGYHFLTDEEKNILKKASEE